jgi:hypothetical protein
MPSNALDYITIQGFKSIASVEKLPLRPINIVQRTAQQVTPFFDDFQLRPLKPKPDDIKLEWRHKNSDQYFDASALSDGTLRFICIGDTLPSARRISPIADPCG